MPSANTPSVSRPSAYLKAVTRAVKVQRKAGEKAVTKAVTKVEDSDNA